MKALILSLLLLSSLNAYSFSCMCSGELSSAFSSMETHLLDNNINVLSAELDTLIQDIENSNTQLVTNRVNLEKDFKRTKLMLQKAKEYLFNLKEDNQINRESL